MTTNCSHWGFQDTADEAGSYDVARPRAVKAIIGLVLTEAGEVLINRICAEPRTVKGEADDCCVAIVIGRLAHGLSRPQAERMQRAWDMAVAVANGHSEAVKLQPMPHHWRFSRTDYLTIDEWQALRPPIESSSDAPDLGFDAAPGLA